MSPGILPKIKQLLPSLYAHPAHNDVLVGHRCQRYKDIGLRNSDCVTSASNLIRTYGGIAWMMGHQRSTSSGNSQHDGTRCRNAHAEALRILIPPTDGTTLPRKPRNTDGIGYSSKLMHTHLLSMAAAVLRNHGFHSHIVEALDIGHLRV